MKFAQTIIAIALATAGAQAFAASDSKIIAKNLVAAANHAAENTEKVMRLRGIDPKDEYAENRMREWDVCASFIIDSMKPSSKDEYKYKYKFNTLATAPLDDDVKSEAMKMCVQTFQKVGVMMTKNMGPGKTQLGANGNKYLVWSAKSPLTSAEKTLDQAEDAFQRTSSIVKVLDRAEVQYRAGHSELSGLTGPRMVTKPSQLSKDAGMELAGYERVGSYRTDCESDRRWSDDSTKELKSESCTIYKERGKDLPSVSIN